MIQGSGLLKITLFRSYKLSNKLDNFTKITRARLSSNFEKYLGQTNKRINQSIFIDIEDED